jgi:hypothetical protein
MQKVITNIEHTVGPASKDVPESTIAAQPPSQTPKNNIRCISESCILCNQCVYNK